MVAALIACSFLAAPAVADYRVGDVVVVVALVDLKVDGRPVDRVYPGYTLEVLKVDGGSLWVENLVAGWLDSSKVVPPDQAIRRFTKAINRDPANANLYQARAKVWVATKNFDDAIDDLDEAIALVPTWPGFVFDRGNAYLGKGDLDRAIADFTKSIRLNADDPMGYNQRGICFANRRDYAGAMADFEAAHRMKPAYVEPARNLARLLACCEDARHRDGKRAVDLSRSSCELARWSDPRDLHTLACAEAENGNLAEAVRWEQRAIDLNPPAKTRNLKVFQAALARFQAGQPYHELPPIE